MLDGDPAPPPKGHSLPIFGSCLFWPNTLSILAKHLPISATAEQLFLFGFVRQIKLTARQLLGAR